MAHRIRPFRRNFTFAVLAAAVGLGAVATFAGDDVAAPHAGVAPASSAQEGAARGEVVAFDTSRGAVAVVHGCWTAPIGSCFRHRVADRLDVTLHSAEGGAQPGGAIHTQCEVTSTVLDRRDGETLVRQQIDALTFVGTDGRPITGDPVQQSFATAAAEPVLVRIDERGRVLGLGFANGLNGDQRNFLRGTLALLAFEAPPAGADADAWTSRVEDTTGEFEARHEVQPAGADDEVAVRRTRVRYTAIAGHDTVPEHDVRGATDARFATRLGWLQSVHVDEGFSLALSLLDLRAITARNACVELIAADTVAVGGDLAAAWASADAPVSGRVETLGAFAKDSERRQWQQRLEGVTVDDLLAELQTLLAAQPVDHEALDRVFQQMQWLVALDERAAAAMLDRITARQIADGVAGSVLGALGAAGTPAAQHALATVRGNASLGEAVRASATIACLQLAEPDAAIVGGLFAEASGDSTPGLRGPSLLVLGALAPRTDAQLADGRTPLQAILGMEGDAAARGELATWMLAVGNAKAPQTLAIAQRLFDHADPAVRGACIVAIRSIVDRAALETIVQRGLVDADPTVRYEAVLALSRRSEPQAREGLEQAALDVDPTVRNRALAALGRS